MICSEEPHRVILRKEMWKACHIGGAEQSALNAEARQLLGIGICQILSCLAEDARLKGFENLLSFPQNELDKQAQRADEARDEATRKQFLAKVAGEIRLIAALCRSLTNSATVDTEAMESGCPSSPDRRELVPSSVMTVVRRSWPKIAQLASTYSFDEVSHRVNAPCLCSRCTCSYDCPLSCRMYPVLSVRCLWISCLPLSETITVSVCSGISGPSLHPW